jgi:arylsulfatase A
MRAPTDKPNIILINCDDLGYGDLSCYGSTLNRTPALDKLADEGVRFTDFYQAAPVCTPSRAALMTGCYPQRVSLASVDNGDWVLFPGQSMGLNPDEKSMATLLKEQGYATSIVGKWHLGDQEPFLPTKHGFDEYYGLPYSNDMGLFTDSPYCPLPLMDGVDVIEEQPDQASLTERYVERALRFIRANQDGPFFLYFAHMYVHTPIIAPQKFVEASRNKEYGAAVEHIDFTVEQLMHELKVLGLDENTIVMFTSDNGSEANDWRYGLGSNDPLRGTKGTTWEGGQRLPFIVRWAGQLPAGETCSAMSTSMDLVPTLTALAGGSAPMDRIIDGYDVREMWFSPGEATTPYKAFFYYLQEKLEAVRSGDWKLHVVSGELYNLAADIGETTDVAADHTDVVAELEALAQACREDLGDSVTGTQGANRRPAGKVDNPKRLTAYDPNHPYMIALYD